MLGQTAVGNYEMSAVNRGKTFANARLVPHDVVLCTVGVLSSSSVYTERDVSTNLA